jgi:hypothetical protein
MTMKASEAYSRVWAVDRVTIEKVGSGYEVVFYDKGGISIIGRTKSKKVAERYKRMAVYRLKRGIPLPSQGFDNSTYK